MTCFNKQMVCILCVLGLLAMPVMARGTAELIADGWVLWDYPSIPTTTVPDTVNSVDYPWAMGGSDIIPDGNGALYIGEQARAWYRFADTPVFGEISFLVYDRCPDSVRRGFILLNSVSQNRNTWLGSPAILLTSPILK